jgi:hypothetical protein
MEIKLLKNLGIVKNHNNRQYAYYQTEYGIVKCDLMYLKKGHKVTITSAINKKSFLENYVRKKYQSNIRILENFKDGNSKILIKINGFKYYVFVGNLKKKFPNILSCIDKESQTIYTLNKIHNNYYDYPNFKYTNSSNKIKVHCPIHGLFEQSLQSHLKGSGCSICAHQKSALKRITYTKGINNAIVYCIKMTDIDGTIFYKIGFTRHSVKFRFINTYQKMPYDYEIIYEKVLPYKEALLEENKLHKKLSQQHYVPKIKFDGSATECFLNYTYE